MEDEKLKATKKAMGLLQHMDRTEWELRSKLEQAGFSEEAVEAAIQYVAGYHYIDDKEVCKAVCRNISRIPKYAKNTSGFTKKTRSGAVDHAGNRKAVDEDDTPALQKALEKLLRGRTELSYEEQQKVNGKTVSAGVSTGGCSSGQIDLWREQNDCQ